MNFLEQLHADITREYAWTHKPGDSVASFDDRDGNTVVVEFHRDDDGWTAHFDRIDEGYSNTYQKIFNSFIQHALQTEYDFKLTVEASENTRTFVSQMVKETVNMNDLDAIVTGTNKLLFHIYEYEGDWDGEVLTEEPNTSLMYHKLFPNKKLLRQLENFGYKFSMGQGLKIYKKHYASTHRGSGPSKRRTLQSLVIHKDGQMFRKIPKPKWVQLVDPSDKDSETWGTVFMKKMLKAEEEKQEARKKKLEAKKKERLATQKQ